MYHNWDVKNDFAYVLQFFSLISEGVGCVCTISPLYLHIMMSSIVFFSLLEGSMETYMYVLCTYLLPFVAWVYSRNIEGCIQAIIRGCILSTVTIYVKAIFSKWKYCVSGKGDKVEKI